MSGKMELELGLALPDHNPTMIRGLDLNNCSNNGLEMENPIQKRSFLDDQHGVEVESKLSLLLGSGGRQLDEKEDGGRRPKSRKLRLNDESSEEENHQEIDGWPPINSSRKELPGHHHGGFAAAEQKRNSTYVKVKMEGVAIGRKIDLRHYDSYQDLTSTLIDMFAKQSKIDRNREEYTLLYQDKEGDWMLARDVQWETFVETVQRLEILKNDNKLGSDYCLGNVTVKYS